MTDLVSLNINYDSEELKISGRELHKNLEVQTKYSTWFPRMIEYGFEENKDYWTQHKSVPRPDGTLMPNPQINHLLSIDMAKEIAMIQRNEIGKSIKIS